MSPDRLSPEQVLAARRQRFETAVNHLKGSGAVGMAEMVAKEIPGAEASVVDGFEPHGAMFPQVRLKGPLVQAGMFSNITGDHEVLERAEVIIWSDGSLLRMHRWNHEWSQKPGNEAIRGYGGGHRTGDILFDPKTGTDLLKQGLASNSIFPELLPL